jgi:hypothetical protein
MILAVTTIIVLTITAAVIIREAHRLLYAREVRHLPMVSELQARQNSKPLTHAVINPNLPADHE